MSLVALARHIAIALQDDGEVLLCTENTPRIWESLGVVLLRGSLLSAASDRDILATDLPVMKSLAAKLVAHGQRRQQRHVVLNECRVVSEPAVGWRASADQPRRPGI